MLVPTCESTRRRNPSYLNPEALEFVFLMCKRLETKHISSEITASYVLEYVKLRVYRDVNLLLPSVKHTEWSTHLPLLWWNSGRTTQLV
jgi:hypothetical protein